MKNYKDFDVIHEYEESKNLQQRKVKNIKKYVYIFTIIVLILFVIVCILLFLTSMEKKQNNNKVSNSNMQLLSELSQKNDDGSPMKTIYSSVCRSYIPFSIDISTKLTPGQFKYMKSFLLHPFLSSVFPEYIQPAPFSTYSEQNHGYRRPNNVSDIVIFVENAAQGNSDYSFITRPLKYFGDQNVTNLATAELAVNTIIFAGNSLANADIPTVQNYTSILTTNGNTLTVVLMNPNIDQTNYRQVFGLNIVIWSDSATTVSAIRNVMNCEPQPSTSTIITTTAATPLTSSESISSSVTTPVSTSESLSSSTVSSTMPSSTPTSREPTNSSTISLITVSTLVSTAVSTASTTTVSTTTSSPTSGTTINTESNSESTSISPSVLTTIDPWDVCFSYTPFSFDISQKLSTTQFAEMKAFLVNTFLVSVFSKYVHPAWYSTYDSVYYNYTRPADVAEIIRAIPSVNQTSVAFSLFNQPLLGFITENVMNLGYDDGLFVNTIIFAGSSLSDADLENAQDNGEILTQNGNTLTVVLVNPNIDQTNYRQVPGLNIVVWSNPATTIAAITQAMNCRPV